MSIFQAAVGTCPHEQVPFKMAWPYGDWDCWCVRVPTTLSFGCGSKTCIENTGWGVRLPTLGPGTLIWRQAPSFEIVGVYYCGAANHAFNILLHWPCSLSQVTDNPHCANLRLVRGCPRVKTAMFGRAGAETMACLNMLRFMSPARWAYGLQRFFGTRLFLVDGGRLVEQIKEAPGSINRLMFA